MCWKLAIGTREESPSSLVIAEIARHRKSSEKSADRRDGSDRRGGWVNVDVVDGVDVVDVVDGWTGWTGWTGRETDGEQLNLGTQKWFTECPYRSFSKKQTHS